MLKQTFVSTLFCIVNRLGKQHSFLFSQVKLNDKKDKIRIKPLIKPHLHPARDAKKLQNHFLATKPNRQTVRLEGGSEGGFLLGLINRGRQQNYSPDHSYVKHQFTEKKNVRLSFLYIFVHLKSSQQILFYSSIPQMPDKNDARLKLPNRIFQ